jgi:hypothetical protein
VKAAPRVLAVAVALIVTPCVAAEARARISVKVSYQTRLGYSQEVCRDVDFFAGSEIDALAARRVGISYLKNYAAIWFSGDEVALVELRGVTWFGEATEDDITIVGAWYGKDQDGTEWQFRSGLLCPSW